MSFDDLPSCRHRYGAEPEYRSARCALMRGAPRIGWQVCGKLCDAVDAPKRDTAPGVLIDIDAYRYFDDHPLRAVGVGDTVAYVINFFVLIGRWAFKTKPAETCVGCKARRRWLNFLLPYWWREEWRIYRDRERYRAEANAQAVANQRLKIVDHSEADHLDTAETAKVGNV